MSIKPNRQATKLEQLMLRQLMGDPTLVVHHVTEDSPYRLQLEVERRVDGKIVFERMVVN